MRSLALAAGLMTVVGCNKSEGPTEDFLGSDTNSGKANGSAGGFAAALAGDMKGSGKAAATGSASGDSSPPRTAGTASSGNSSGSAMAGSGAKAGSGSAMAGSAMAGSAMAGSAMAGSAMKAGSGSSVAVAAGSGGGIPIKVGVMSTGEKIQPVPVAQGSDTTPAPQPPRPHLPVKPSAELAAIQLKLAPKWERDIDEAATFMRTVDIVSREYTFVFRYGYDDAAAPKDRDAYMKYLADKKILLPANPNKPLLNRQRGAAWYLEGVDDKGAPAFRYLVNFGDKKLICGGPLYKDTGLGDVRDDVIIQAKSICESISL